MFYQQQIEKRKVANLKWLYSVLEKFFIAVWGLTIIDLIAIGVNGGIFEAVDGWIKTLMAAAGFIYFVWRMAITLPHKKRMLKLDFEKRKLELEQMKKGSETLPNSD